MSGLFNFSRYIIALLFLVYSVQVNAQKKDYYKGYIVNLSYDTISGFIQDREEGTFEDLHKRVHFKPEGKIWKKKYSPKDILGYGYENHVFESVPLKEEMDLFVVKYFTLPTSPKVFLKLIQRNDHLTYYLQEFVDYDNFVIDNYPLFHKNGSDEMVRVTQGILGLKKKRLIAYFFDCSALISAIDRNELKQPQEVFDFYSFQCK